MDPPDASLRQSGALHEIGGHLSLGPPKTPAAVRDILLPPFLVDLLHQHLTSHDHEHAFIGRDGGLPRRSSFHRRTWQPAADGNPTKSVAPIGPGRGTPPSRPMSERFGELAGEYGDREQPVAGVAGR